MTQELDELIAAAQSAASADYPPELVAFVQDCGIRTGLDDVPFSDVWDIYNQYTANPINRLSLGNFLSSQFKRYRKGRRTIYMLDKASLTLHQGKTNEGQEDTSKEQE